MKKAYYLKTCNTCNRILKEVHTEGFELQEIKNNPVTAAQLQEMYSLTNSYEALFNKRARLYKSEGLTDKHLTENDFKTLLLKEYTFLKRPVFILDNKIFAGNSKKTITALKEIL